MAKLTDEEYILAAIKGVADAELRGDIPRQPIRVVVQFHRQVDNLLAEVVKTAMAWSDDVEKLGAKINTLTEQSMVAQDKNQRLRAALHDAISRPKGVVPDSAAEFYRNGIRTSSCDS